MIAQFGRMTAAPNSELPSSSSTCGAPTGATATARHFPKAKLICFDDDTLGFQEAANGNVDGVSSTPPKAAFEIEKHGDKLWVVSPELSMMATVAGDTLPARSSRPGRRSGQPSDPVASADALAP